MARPDNLTAAVREKLLEAAAAGMTRKLAADAAGIHESTLYAWLREDRADRPRAKFLKFSQEFRQIEAEFAAKLLKTIEAASTSDWKAASWLLERKFRTEYGKQASAPPSPNSTKLHQNPDADPPTDPTLEEVQKLELLLYNPPPPPRPSGKKSARGRKG